MPCTVLERGLSPEEIEEAVEQLQQNWELAAVFDFFQVNLYTPRLLCGACKSGRTVLSSCRH